MAAVIDCAEALQLKQCSSTTPPACARLAAFQVTDSEGVASSCIGQDAMNAWSPRVRVAAPADSNVLPPLFRRLPNQG
jgi:hypothetical protein